jgi:hypothetical protein
MNYKEINAKLLEIIELNQQLEKLSYNDPAYDTLEDKIHDIQDKLNQEHGEYFEKIISGIYKQLKADDDILNFTDYFARNYQKNGENQFGDQYSVDPEDCIQISFKHDSLKGKTLEGCLYFKPNPLRITFLLGTQERTLWDSEAKK